jgi:hypothetical protein
MVFRSVDRVHGRQLRGLAPDGALRH